MIKATKQMIARDVAALPENYKTKDVDALIARYVKDKYDVSCLRGCVLSEQEFHRIYYYVSLKQIKNVRDRAAFIDNNLLFSDWWHTDQLIHFVSALDFDTAYEYSKKYINSGD